MELSDRRLNEVFVGALEIPAGPERFAYVERECLGDAPLRDRVMALLAAHENAGGFLAPTSVTDAHGDEFPQAEPVSAELPELSRARPDLTRADPLVATTEAVSTSAPSRSGPTDLPSPV